MRVLNVTYKFKQMHTLFEKTENIPGIRQIVAQDDCTGRLVTNP